MSEQANAFFAREGMQNHPPLVSVDDERLPRAWYGGTKMLEVTILIGALNHFPLQAFIKHLQSIEWGEMEVVQLFIKDQEDTEFRLIDISKWEAD